LLKPAQGQKLNHAKQEIDMRQLLLYCGMDTFLEIKAARKQFRQLEARHATESSD